MSAEMIPVPAAAGKSTRNAAAALKSKEIAIDPKIFDAYVGDYEIEPGVILNFSRKGDKLYGWLPNLPQMEVFPESDTTFFIKEPNAQFTFMKDATGKVDRLISICAVIARRRR